MAKRFVIIGGGPAGNTAATYAARFGAEVTMIEKDLVGGAAHLRDCIPSKAMIATGGALGTINDAQRMGLTNVSATLDFDALRHRIDTIGKRLERSTTSLLESQGVTLLKGTGRLVGPHQVVAETADGPLEIEADVVLIATGSRPRIPEWAHVDGERMLTTRDAYPPSSLPEHLVVIGSGVTGVEFVHMFKSFGSEVTLIVSRQQVLPLKDPEVAAALEADFLARGVRLLKGAKALSGAVSAMGLHIGPHRHIDYEKAASAIFTEPEIADVGLAEADAFAMGRKIRVTKVPFSANAKALIEDDSRGFVKIVSDPATGVVLGGSIVGRHAAELIAVLALAVSAGLRVNDLHESLFVHPSMAEALSDAAE